MFKKLKSSLNKFKENFNVVKKIDESKSKKIINDLEDSLITSNIAYSVIEKLIEDIKDNKSKEIKSTLKKSLDEILSVDKINILDNSNKPTKIMFIGVNGAGKTTTIAKIANLILKNKKSCVIAAGDTFRAAAIEQINEHGKNLGVKVISHDYGSDSTAVAYDAVDHAKSKKIDFVLIDTAGRNQANKDLMNELKKMKNKINPDFTIMVIDSMVGNDSIEQAKNFEEEIGIDGFVMTKTDAEETGGSILSVIYETKKPIVYLGSGQNYEDLTSFDKEKIIKQIL
ncbi:MAG: signal recognition particle-docking protein FtsY [Candidatus Woesearchaeota archaeon]